MTDSSSEKTYQRDSGEPISETKLRSSKTPTQMEVMRQWFYERFEDPVHHCPYDEGEYVYIYGGPYDAEEQLREEFDGIVREKALEQLIEELSSEGSEWSSTSDFSDDLDYDYDPSDFYTPHEAFKISIEEVKSLLQEQDIKEQQALHKLLYANVIAALETYLADFFISNVRSKDRLIRNFVETTPEFKQRKFTLSELFERTDDIEKIVHTYLREVIWHRLDIVIPMYKDTLNIQLKIGLKKLFDAILVRHDIVHRNGNTKEKMQRTITREMVTDLLETVEALVNDIETQWKHLNRPASERLLDDFDT